MALPETFCKLEMLPQLFCLPALNVAVKAAMPSQSLYLCRRLQLSDSGRYTCALNLKQTVEKIVHTLDIEVSVAMKYLIPKCCGRFHRQFTPCSRGTGR